MTRVLICGGRDFHNIHLVIEAMTGIIMKHGEVTRVIHGGAPGADAVANLWARTNGLPVDVYVPQWRKHGRSAGPRRNARMLAEGRPDLVVAFPGGKGTADMVRQAEAAGVKVERIVR